jgi:hypothetical protein
MISTVGQLRIELLKYYDSQPISLVCDDTSEMFEILFTEVNAESEVEVFIR